jgi:hypothetical protein
MPNDELFEARSDRGGDGCLSFACAALGICSEMADIASIDCRYRQDNQHAGRAELSVASHRRATMSYQQQTDAAPPCSTSPFDL